MATNSKLIAKNTMMLYLRMFLVIAIQLYTVPVVLKYLGVEDYGIYNVVAGVVTMFTFVNGSMATGTQRFLAYAIGRNDKDGLKAVFNANITVYAIFSIIVFILLEGFGIWFVNTKLVIPEERLWVANWIFQMSVFNFVVSLMTTSYSAAIIAHEKMNMFAYIGILDCVLKLIVVFLLQLSPIDYLLTYACLQSLCGILIMLLYQIYCKSKFDECKRYRFEWNKVLIKDLLSYASLNVIGSLANILCTSGVNLIQNVFFGPVLNAAHSIAQQIQGVLSQFTGNVRVAVKPQIVKSYACGELDSMWSLLFRSGKLTFYLFIFITVPVLIELPTILSLWLKIVPEYTVHICRMLLISLLIDTISAPLIAVFQAANKQKHVQLISSGILLLTIPVSYCVLCVYNHVLVAYTTLIVLGIISSLSRIIIARYDVGLEIWRFLYDVVFKDTLCICLAYLSTYILVSTIDAGFVRVILTCVVSSVFTALIVWTLGLDRIEKEFVLSTIKKKVIRIK